MIPVKLMYQNSKNTNNSFVIVGRYDYIILKKMYKHILDADIIFFLKFKRWNERYVKASKFHR